MDSNKLGARKSIGDSPWGTNYQDKYTVEKEDDIGQIQLVSGGFGDANDLDEAALQLLAEKQALK